MTTVKPVQLGLTPEMTNYFEAINLHMQVHKKPHLITFSPTKSPVKDTFLSETMSTSSSSSSDFTILDNDALLETQLISEMMKQLRVIDEHSDPKKIELGHDVQNSFNELWSENLAVIIKAIEFLRSIFKDVHRYWPYLEGQMDRLVMACARVIGLMFTRYKSSLFVNAHDATRAPIINLLNSTAQLFNSIIRKSPVLPSKILSETYSSLLESLIPYYLLSKEETQKLDPHVESKIESFITNMLSMSELNNLLLALLCTITSKLVEYQMDPTRHEKQMNILIKWIEQLGYYLDDSKVTNLNLDLILNEADLLIRAYPSTVYEISRDFRLLEAIREIVFKIVEYKGDPGIWDHISIIDLDQGDTGVIMYINIALERSQVFKLSSPNMSKPIEMDTEDDCEDDDVEQRLQKYKPIIPVGLKLSMQKDNEDPELGMFFHWLNNIANTSDPLQAQLCLDYINQNLDDLVLKFATALEPEMDALIQACTRQYHLFTILYYPPNIGQPSYESLQIFHSITSLLKRIFTSTISLKYVTSETMSHLILLISSLRLSWSSHFTEEGLTQLESSILTNESLDKSALICICIRVMRFEQTHTNNQKYSTFGDIQRFARQMLAQLTLQFVSSSMLAEQYDLNAILCEINEYCLSFDGHVLQKSFDRFLNKEKFSEPADDNNCQFVIEHLIYYIDQQRHDSIFDNLNSILSSSKISEQLLRFIHELALTRKLLRTQVESALTGIKQLNELKQKIIPQLRFLKSPISNSNVRYSFNQKSFNQKLTKMINHYDEFTPAAMPNAVDCLTEVCCCGMINFLDYYNHPKVNKAHLMESYQNIGELLRKMYGKAESLGHKYVTMARLKELFHANFSMLLKYTLADANYLYRDFGWIVQFQYKLTSHSKPYYVLPLALEEFNAFLMKGFSSDGMIQNKATNYFLVQLYSSMLELSCEQMFFSSTAIYTPQWDSDKFDVGAFLRQVDDLFAYYPISYLEKERDYKILVLIRRILHRLYEHHRLLIRQFWSTSSQATISQSPVCAFFEQVIAKDSKIEQM